VTNRKHRKQFCRSAQKKTARRSVSPVGCAHTRRKVRSRPCRPRANSLRPSAHLAQSLPLTSPRICQSRLHAGTLEDDSVAGRRPIIPGLRIEMDHFEQSPTRIHSPPR